MSAEITVQISSLAFGGSGVGRVVDADDESMQGMCAFVPFSTPGDVVRAVVKTRHKRHLEAEIENILEPSQLRVDPVCRHFTDCGGCHFQHFDYATELAQKKEMIRAAMRAAGISETEREKVEDVYPSLPYGYRRRATLQVGAGGALGFHRRGTHEVVSLSQCPILVDSLNNCLAELAKLSGDQIPGLRRVQLEETAERVFLTFEVATADVAAEVLAVASHLQELGFEVRVVGNGQELKPFTLAAESGLTAICSGSQSGLQSGALKIKGAPGSFTQVNASVNSALVGFVQEIVPHCDSVLDLYSGAGNFTLPFAASGARVTAVEMDERLVAAGRESALLNNLADKVDYQRLSVEKFLAASASDAYWELVICDPPRCGLREVQKTLPLCRQLVLVSCHLPGFVSDLRYLLSAGWTLERLKPFDMFARTTYTEIVSLLRPPEAYSPERKVAPGRRRRRR